MQALILAAGLGRRLLPYTESDTKCMVPVQGVPLIDRMLDILTEVPVTRVVIVVGHGGNRVKAHVGDRWNGVPIVYLDNEEYAKTNNIYSLYLAAPFVQEEDVILLESDLIFDPRVITDLVADPRPDVAVVDRVEAWMSGTVMRLDPHGNVLGFGSSTDAAASADVFKTVNIYKFSSRFIRSWLIPQLTQRIDEIGRTEYYEEVLKQIVEMRADCISAMCLDQQDWYEIDTADDLARAEQLFPQRWNHYRRMMARYGGYWRFPTLKDFCYLVNPFFPPPELREEIAARAARLLSEYPSSQAYQASAAAKVFDVEPDCLAVGNGASEIINALSVVLAGKRIALTLPTFEEYSVRLTGAELVLIYSDVTAGRDRLHLLEEADSDAVVLVNPDNPSGSYIAKGDVLEFVDRAAARGRLVIVDDSFADFSGDGLEGRILTREVLASHPNLIVIRSLGKSQGVAGLRLGLVATSSSGVIEATRARLPVWNINSLAEEFLGRAPAYDTDYWRACAAVAAERHHIEGSLRALGNGYPLPSGANFVTFVLEPPHRSEEIAARMLRKGFLVKDLSRKPGAELEALRIAVRTREENVELVTALRESIGE